MLHDREPEPGAAARARLVAAVEALEQARQVGWRRRPPPSSETMSTGPPAAIRQLDRARAARPGVADRVRERGSRRRRAASAAAAAARRGVGRDVERDLGVLGAVGERGDDLLDTGSARVRPSETTSRPVSSSPRKSTSSISSRVCCDLLPRLLHKRVDVGAGKRRALEQDEQPRERRPQLVRDRRREALPELLVGRELGQRSRKRTRGRGCGGERSSPTRRPGVASAERGRGRRARGHEPPLAVEHDDGLALSAATSRLTPAPSFTTPSPLLHPPATRRPTPRPDNDTNAEGADRRGRRGDRPGDGAPSRRRRLRRRLGRQRRRRGSRGSATRSPTPACST